MAIDIVDIPIENGDMYRRSFQVRFDSPRVAKMNQRVSGNVVPKSQVTTERSNLGIQDL